MNDDTDFQVGRRVLNIPALTLIYILTGIPDLLLTDHPGIVTAVFPVAGIAMAWLLVGGLGLWPGIFFGSIGLNLLPPMIGHHEVSAEFLEMITVIAAGQTLQGVLGVAMIRRFPGFPNPLTNIRDISGFHLLSLASCLVASGIGIAALDFGGEVWAGDLAFVWWGWFLTDATSIFFITPLVLTAFGKKEDIWGWRRHLVPIPMMIAVVVLVFFSLFAQHRKQDHLNSSFIQDTESLDHALIHQLDRYTENIWSLENYFAGSELVTRQEFKEFTKRTLSRNTGIKAISWNQVVTAAGRKDFEAEIKGEGFADFHILERDEKGRMMPAADRPEYIVVKYIEPFAANKKAFLYDVASNPVRRTAFHTARDQGSIVATGRIALVQGSPYQSGALILIPIYDKVAILDTVDERRKHLLGYGVGVFHIQDLLQTAIAMVSKHHARHFTITLYDDSATDEPDRLMATMAQQGDVIHSDSQILDTLNGPAGFSRRYSYDVGGRKWVMELRSTHWFVHDHRHFWAWFLPPLGMLFIGIVGSFLLIYTGRAFRLQSMARTLESRSLSLEMEIEKREGIESQLRLSRDRLIKAQRITRMGFLDLNLDMAVDLAQSGLYLSQEIYRLFGIDPDNCENRLSTFLDMCHPDDREMVQSNLESAISGETIYRIEHRIIRKDGQTIWIMAQGELSYDAADKPTQLLLSIVDITELKNLEKRIVAAEWMASTGRMAAGMAHEVNNPLTSVSINLQELRRKLQGWPLQRDIYNHMDIIERNLRRADKIVKEVLAFSSHGSTNFSPVNVNDVIETALESIEHRMEHIKINEDLGDVPDIDGLFSKLEQVFYNTFDNALYTMPEEGALDIVSRHEGDEVVVTVTDSGLGMSETIIDKVFDPFFTTKEIGEGTGLGLSVCYGIINLHKGTLEIANAPKRGARVTIRLPVGSAKY